ncbi:MAG: FAD-dependent oxidoreductase [Ardenticatenaceae bacterium]|nr:FAD-dependent oxidoreductase [Ardenticatenaceae bacterium]
MWNKNWREEIWQNSDQPWDIVVVGGGITGAGILREATRLGLKTLLVEQRDFAFGTSSRSSKLVHGGLRYLKQGKIGLTQASVQERQKLQESAPGLVDPLKSGQIIQIIVSRHLAISGFLQRLPNDKLGYTYFCKELVGGQSGVLYT